MNKCPHCIGDFDSYEPQEEDSEHEYEIIRVFESQYKGTCNINRSHAIKRGDKVAFVQYADNPLIPVAGVACKLCIKEIRYA